MLNINLDLLENTTSIKIWVSIKDNYGDSYFYPLEFLQKQLEKNQDAE